METAILQIIKYLITVLAGIILGNGAVYMFNHMPGKWFMDYSQEPSGPQVRPEDQVDPQGRNRPGSQAGDQPEPKTDVFGAAGPESLRDWWPGAPQRVRSTPWKYLFSMLFIATGLYLVQKDWVYAAAVLIVGWILLELAIADIKYRIVPDQLLVLLAVSAIGLIQYHSAPQIGLFQDGQASEAGGILLNSGWLDMLCGAALGLGIIGVTALLGRAMYKREAVGGGDIKLFAALGLVLGVRGILTVFMISALLSGAHMVFLLATRRIKRKDTIPMVPYIAAAAGIYLVFLWQGPAAVWLDTIWHI